MLSQAEVILIHARLQLSSTDHMVEHMFIDAEGDLGITYMV